MKYVVKIEGRFNTYFRTKKEAIAYINEFGGKLYGRCGCVLYELTI